MQQLLSVLPLQSLAESSGFFQRRAKKLSLEALLQSVLWSLCSSNYSLESVGRAIERLTDQALQQRGPPSTLYPAAPGLPAPDFGCGLG